MAESWIPKAEEGEAPPPLPFDPTLMDYKELPKRLAKSVGMAGAEEHKATIQKMEDDLEELK